MTLSTGAKVGIGIGVVVGLIALGLLIWFVIWPAIANAMGKGKEYTYNGGGSGSNNYIRTWIDNHALVCSNRDWPCTDDKLCTVSAGFAQLITQDRRYILSYNDKKEIFLSNIDNQKDYNIWYLCFYNKNAPQGEKYGYQYNGTLIAANQLCNGGKNLCNLFWECSSTQGNKPCSQLTNYPKGNYPPDKVTLDTGCKVSGNMSCSLSTHKCVYSTKNALPCVSQGNKNAFYVEQGVYINSDDTFSTMPVYSNSHNNDNCDEVACMAHTNYLGVDISNYHLSPTLVGSLGVRFKIVDCDATQIDGIWTCAPQIKTEL